DPNLALNAYFLFYKMFNINCEECLVTTDHGIYINLILNNITSILISKNILSENTLDLNKTKSLKRMRADSRIGPHNKNIISIIFGSLLGDGYAEYRSKGNGTRISFYQEGIHLSYLLWLHKLLSDLEYCNPTIPDIQKRLGTKGVVRKIIRFNTWTYSSFNWIQELWYVNGKKSIPSNIGDYLDPLALAIWIMDDGSKSVPGLKLSTNSFSYSECLLLIKVLYENFNIKASIQSVRRVRSTPHTGSGYQKPQYCIYIWKESMPLLSEIVEPYVHSSMKYKLGKW
uniref:LAGLIDADG endonuclease n=1 Tax=Ramaria rubella TaxID=113071 RepID=UPI00223754C0